MAIFELGNLICALSTSSNMVNAGRTVAGFGASGLFNGAVVILTACSPPKIRPLVTACGISMIAIGGIVGPLVGGDLLSMSAGVGVRFSFALLLGFIQG
jgi:MFS family permease